MKNRIYPKKLEIEQPKKSAYKSDLARLERLPKYKKLVDSGKVFMKGSKEAMGKHYLSF